MEEGLYSEKAGLNSLKREIILNRNTGFVKLTDKFQFSNHQKNSYTEHFYSYNDLKKENNNIFIKGEKTNLKMTPEKEDVMETEFIEKAVGDKDAYRIKFTEGNIENNDIFTIKFIPVH